MDMTTIDFKGVGHDASLKIDKRNIMYHYTSSTGLLGILNEDCINLRFTRYDCVNDVSEGENIVHLYCKACNELYDNKEISLDFYNHIYQVRPLNKKTFYHKSKENKYIGNQVESVPYICCFSLEVDSLPLWNYYVKDGNYQGYNMGFDSRIFVQYLEENRCGYPFDVIKVLYDDGKKKKIIKRIIKKINEIEEIYKQSFSYLLSYFLQELSLVFKSEYFKHEKEVRAIIYMPISPDNKQEKYRLDFYTKNAYIIPYVTIPFINKPYLNQITIGPLQEKEISQNTIKSLLDERGYTARIINSEAPIRF